MLEQQSNGEGLITRAMIHKLRQMSQSEPLLRHLQSEPLKQSHRMDSAANRVLLLSQNYFPG